MKKFYGSDFIAIHHGHAVKIEAKQTNCVEFRIHDRGLKALPKRFIGSVPLIQCGVVWPRMTIKKAFRMRAECVYWLEKEFQRLREIGLTRQREALDFKYSDVVSIEVQSSEESLSELLT